MEYSTAREAIVDRPWEVVPTDSSEYQVCGFSGILLASHGTADSGGTSSITLADSALPSDGSYVGCSIYLASGTGSGQTRLITAYGIDRVAVVSPPWEIQPDETTVYKVLPTGRSIVESFGTIAKEELQDKAHDAIQDRQSYPTPTSYPSGM